MTCVTLSLPRPWSDSTSPVPRSQGRSGGSWGICYRWRTLTASQVRRTRCRARVVKGNQVVGRAESEVAVKGITIFPGPYCTGLGKSELHKHQP